jgi:hypothetical protein
MRVAYCLWEQILKMDNHSSKVSHYLGHASGWRKKRLKIAMALRNQGWTHKLIAEYLEVSPKSLMRDIKCFIIDPKGLRTTS